jgi:hypothetical protein
VSLQHIVGHSNSIKFKNPQIHTDVPVSKQTKEQNNAKTKSTEALKLLWKNCPIYDLEQN